MRKPLLSLSALLAATAVFFATARAEQKEKPVSPPAGAASEEAKYTRAIEGRTADILALLGINDSAKSARVHDVILAQYRALRDWHDANDAKLKALGKE